MSLIDKIVPSKFHTFFLFPFGFNHEINIKALIKRYNDNENWKYCQYDIKKGIDYNEYAFFYPYLAFKIHNCFYGGIKSNVE